MAGPAGPAGEAVKAPQDRTGHLVVLVADEGLHHGHPVGGQGARLVGADGGGVAHGLARVQVPHQVVVAHHFLQNAFVKTVSNFVVAGSRIHQM